MNDEIRHRIAYLEAHWARHLANAIQSECGGLIKDIDDGNLRHPINQDPVRVIRRVCQSLVNLAEESRQEVEAARHVPPDRIDEFVRYHTLPEWRRLMVEAGFSWNSTTYKWEATS